MLLEAHPRKEKDIAMYANKVSNRNLEAQNSQFKMDVKL